MTRHRRPIGMTTALLGGLVLAGCSAAPAAEPTATGSPAASASATPAEEPAAATDRVVPEACASLDLVPGAQLDGTGLGECVATALSGYGSGKMRLTADTFGDVEFSYTPEYNFQGSFQGTDGPIDIVYLDGEMWVDTGTGPILGDLDSDDLEVQLAGVAAEMYRFYSDLEQTAQLIQSQPVWNVAEARDSISLPSGESVESFRITSAGAFTWNEMPVSEFILWFGDDWVPVGDQATMALFGTSATHTQHFYDLGEPVTITPLG